MERELVPMIAVAAAALMGGLVVGLLLARRPVGSPVTTARPEARAATPTSRSVAANPEELADQLHIGVLRLDQTLNVLEANRSARSLLRLDLPRGRRRSVMEAFVDHRVEDAVRSALATGSASIETSRPGSEEVRLLVGVRRASDGGAWVLVEDVTELRRLQRIRAEFIDNLSHELRTPLTTIRLLTETLQAELERSDASPRIRDRVSKIDVETGHLVQMVNELLDLSRIEGGTQQLQLGSVDMTFVVNAATERLRTFADRQGVSLAVEMNGEGDMPRVRGDEDRLGQVLMNLLHNAIKFSPAGSTVTITLRREGNEMLVAVRDEGVGIPPSELPRVFERFYKVDRARVRGQGGTGLGLAIARHIVEGHGGRILAESEEGRGAVFSFSVPIEEGA